MGQYGRRGIRRGIKTGACLHVTAHRQGRQLFLALAVDVDAPLESRRWRSRHDNFGDAVSPAGFDYVEGTIEIDGSVDVLRVVRPNGRRQVPYTRGALADGREVVDAAEVADDIPHLSVGRWRHEESGGLVLARGGCHMQMREAGSLPCVANEESAGCILGLLLSPSEASRRTRGGLCALRLPFVGGKPMRSKLITSRPLAASISTRRRPTKPEPPVTTHVIAHEIKFQLHTPPTSQRAPKSEPMRSGTAGAHTESHWQ